MQFPPVGIEWFSNRATNRSPLLDWCRVWEEKLIGGSSEQESFGGNVGSRITRKRFVRPPKPTTNREKHLKGWYEYLNPGKRWEDLTVSQAIRFITKFDAGKLG